ncbi:hypothetical protein SI65_05253 [Aspergillus cristatus]|uniref:F-box domain-containing protein n=1 Tax=Aspergillus cristatus TaxID=573508 RepID=A0A1E3BE19_ASPCR|nr:hypothetical protein SI65_05253 [Aspergillus cristatus]
MAMTEPIAASSGTRSLQLLPIDCWMDVLDYLSYGDLASVALVSKDFHAFTTPFMYRTLSWNWNTTVPRRRFYGYCGLFLKRPDLAFSIHNVSILSSTDRMQSIHWERPWCDMNWEKESASYTNVIEQAQAIVTRAQLPNGSHWIQKIQLGVPYVFTTMLLSQLHELKSLQLDCLFISIRESPGIMLGHALFTVPEGVLSTFNSLETVDYGGNARIQEEIRAIGDLRHADGYEHIDHGYWRTCIGP